MIDVTTEAVAKLEEHFAGQDERSPIRIYAAQGGCSGPMLGLALDNPGEGDTTFEHEGFTFIADEKLLEATGDVQIHATEYGFQVSSQNPLGGGGCDCNTGCACGGCGS